MQKEAYLRYRPVVLGLALVMLFSAFSVCYNSTAVKASGIASDPTVIIAVDVTNKFTNEPCFQLFTYGIGTTHKKTIRTGCLAGSIVVTQRVPQSQAVFLHERYVKELSENATLSQRGKWQQDITRLMDEKKQILQSSVSINTLIPATTFPCGQVSSAQQTWSPDGSNSYTSTISFYKSSDCSTLGFQTSSLYVNRAGATTYFWDHDEYGGLPWMGAGCQTLTNGNYWHVSNMSYGTGYTWENLVEWNDPVFCYPQSRDMYAHNDIGPLR